MENDSSNSAAAPPWPELRPLSLRLIILSRSRSRSITSHKLFPTATLLVPASEADHYAHTGLEIQTIPDEVAGISAVRNWVLRHFTEDAVVMLDDDISACVCMVSLRCRKLSIPETIAMLENSAWCARGAGARLFGWHQRSDPRLLQRNDPFGVNHWVGGAVGVVRELEEASEAKEGNEIGKSRNSPSGGDKGARGGGGGEGNSFDDLTKQIKAHDWNAEVLGKIPHFYSGESPSAGGLPAERAFERAARVDETERKAKEQAEAMGETYHPRNITISDTCMGKVIDAAKHLSKPERDALWEVASVKYAQAATWNYLKTGIPAIGHVINADGQQVFGRKEWPRLDAIMTDESVNSAKWEKQMNWPRDAGREPYQQ